MRAVTCYALLLNLALAGCGELGSHPIDIPTAGEDGTRAPANDCFMHALYLVEGDTFTVIGGDAQSFDTRGTVRDETGAIGHPDIAPRAKSRADLDNVRGRYQGFVRLYWDDELVQAAELDHAFALGNETVVLAYQAADGTLVEAHAFANPDCAIPTEQTLSRAEVEAREHGP